MIFIIYTTSYTTFTKLVPNAKVLLCVALLLTGACEAKRQPLGPIVPNHKKMNHLVGMTWIEDLPQGQLKLFAERAEVDENFQAAALEGVKVKLSNIEVRATTARLDILSHRVVTSTFWLATGAVKLRGKQLELDSEKRILRAHHIRGFLELAAFYQTARGPTSSFRILRSQKTRKTFFENLRHEAPISTAKQ